MIVISQCLLCNAHAHLTSVTDMRTKTHEECRLESCICCGLKVKPHPGRTKVTPVSPKIAKEIREHAKPEFNPDVASFPLGICQRCRFNLIQCEKKVGGKKKGPTAGIKAIWDSFNLQNIHIPRNQDSLTCRCDICSARRTMFKRDVKVIPRGESFVVDPPAKERAKMVCTDCLQEDVRPGISHPCGPAVRKQNLARLILQEGTAAEQVTAIVRQALHSCGQHHS